MIDGGQFPFLAVLCAQLYVRCIQMEGDEQRIRAQMRANHLARVLILTSVKFDSLVATVI